MKTLLTLVVLATVAFGGATASANSHRHAVKKSERIVVRGDDTVVDAPCPAGICITLTAGAFRGAPVGTGAYDGHVELRLADAFPNGEGGVCAPLRGTITLGTGTPDRLVLGIKGDSCQDGAGNPATSSFTGLGRWVVKHGTGSYAGATGSGTATFLEDAADHERMTLIGRITR